MKDEKELPEQIKIREIWISADPEEPIQMISRVMLNGKPKPKKKQ